MNDDAKKGTLRRNHVAVALAGLQQSSGVVRAVLDHGPCARQERNVRRRLKVSSGTTRVEMPLVKAVGTDAVVRLVDDHEFAGRTAGAERWRDPKRRCCASLLSSLIRLIPE